MGRGISVRGSETIVQAELDQPPVVERAENAAEAGGVDILVKNRPGGMIEEIRRLHAEFDRLSLADLCIFHDPKIQVEGPQAGKGLERTTLRTEQDVRDWVARQEKLLLGAIKQGPVWIN